MNDDRPGPSRRVVEGEAIAWMRDNPADQGSSVITSLPDISELSHLDLSAWRAWFIDAVRAVVRWVPKDGVAIFYQSDIRHGGEWVDKGYLVMRAAEQERAAIVWHKIVCRKPAGTIGLGRPNYSHMVCMSPEIREAAKKPGPDVLPDAGFMPWSRAMGTAACRVACQFLRDETNTRIVVDPFCGRGTALAVANAMGFDAIGVDVAARRCRSARALVLGAWDGTVDSSQDAVIAGARLFNAGAFWEAHEAWEARWATEADPRTRRVLQGLIQIAAAFHKLLVMDAPDSAARLFAKGILKLDAPPTELRLAEFRAQVVACADALRETRFHRDQIPKLVL